MGENAAEQKPIETKMGVKIDPFSHRIALLENENIQLKQILIKIETERRAVEHDLVRLQGEINKYKSEIEKLKNPPLVIGFFKDFLPDGKIAVKSSAGPDFVVNVSNTIDRDKLTPGCRVALDKDYLNVVAVLPSAKDALINSSEILEKPSIKYADIGGLEKQIQEIRETVELPLIRPELFENVGIEPPKGVMLIGPPGTGKTLLAKAVAGETNATFMRLVGSELVQKFIGEGARLVRELFELAKEKAPAIVFIDELDAVGAKRTESGTSGDREVQRTLMQLLAELDGFEPLKGVRIIGATNRPDTLDEALLRPGRFDRIIEIPMPDEGAILQIFKLHIKKMKLEPGIDFESIAKRCIGASGADIRAVCVEAGMFAIRDERGVVSAKDFEKALAKIKEAGGFDTEVVEGMFG